MDLALARRSGQELHNHYVVTRSPEYAPLRRFFDAAVDQLQLVYNTLLVTSAQPQSLIATMRAAVEDCDDLSSAGSLMLLSPPHDIPDATLPVGTTSTQPPTRNAVSPVVMTRRITPANRALQYLEAGRLGASDPHHVLSRPSVPNLCIASSNLLSVMNPLPLDRLSRHMVAAICSWTFVSPVKIWQNMEETSVLHPGSDLINDLDKPIDLDGHILSPFYPREIIYQNCTFLSIAHLMCYRYAVVNNQKTFATGIRKWSRPLRDFPTPTFSTNTEIEQWKVILMEIYTFLCISDSEIRSSLVRSGPRPFTVTARLPWGRFT